MFYVLSTEILSIPPIATVHMCALQATEHWSIGASMSTHFRAAHLNLNTGFRSQSSAKTHSEINLLLPAALHLDFAPAYRYTTHSHLWPGLPSRGGLHHVFRER